MKAGKIVLYLLGFLLMSQWAKSQQTTWYTDIQKEVNLAKELFEQKKYNAAFRQFETIQGKVDEKSELYPEAEYYKSVAALKAGHSSGNRMLSNFLNDYADSPYINQAWFYMGEYQFDKKQYSMALKSFGNVDRDDLNENDRIQLQYQAGYSNLMDNKPDRAAAEFVQIMNKNNLYSKPATYYWSHIMYTQDKFEPALQGFTKLNGDPTYSRFIPIYVSHIYYKQQRYSEVVSYTTSVINDVEKAYRPELSKIIGDSYFHLRNYAAALPYLETYNSAPGLKTREDSYVLGFCYYNAGKFDKAATQLEKASKGKDEMAQNALYHLADSYIKLNNKEKARIAFEAASQMDFNPKISEDALFSFAKLTYELSYSPFNETIKAFDEYIGKYPNNDRNAEAYRYLVDVYMVTRNYKDAISSIEKIKNKSNSILQAYQRVTFYRGLELFNNQDYDQAIDNFDLSIANGSYNRDLNARALYWKAEALFRKGDYDGATSAYNQLSKTPGAGSMQETGDAAYNLGYSYFKSEKYDLAANQFKVFLDANQGKRNQKVADACNRIGDYYFLNANYQQALQYYQQGYNMKIYDADYALFQIAFCQGMLRDQQGKINNLERLISGFPKSEYIDDALYELGRANERLGQNSAAIQQYQKIVSGYRESSFYRKAMLQMGLINFNNGDYNKALSQYKEIAEKFPGTPEAETALLGIKNCYVELNNVDEYFTYTRKIGAASNVTSTEQESLTYLAAERLYMNNDPKAATQLIRYIQQFPDGKYIINARFYLAEIYFRDNNLAEANEHYTYVALQPDNLFSEQALSRSSELTYNEKDYDKALELFERLNRVANSKPNILKSYIGQMRCNFNLNRYQNAIDAADKVKKAENVNAAFVRESNFITGKSYYQLKNIAMALQPLTEVAKDTKTEQGAESKFMIADIYYRQNNKTKAESEINDFIARGTPYLFWLGKSFLLLSDIYMDKGDQFQAKHTLMSLLENYTNETDGIKTEANRKLAAIESGEKAEQKKAIDNSFQLKFNEN